MYESLISEMSSDLKNNLLKIKNRFGSLNFLDNTHQTLLHILVDRLYDEEKCYLAIATLLKAGLNPNCKDVFDYIFIQTALYAGYSENFILRILDLTYPYGLDVNHVDSDKDTIMHTAIYSNDYLGEVKNIFLSLQKNGFDLSRIDHDGRNLVQAMEYEKFRVQKYTEEQLSEFKKLYSTSIKSSEVHPTSTRIQIRNISEEVLTQLEENGILLNKKQYFSNPAIGRDKELKNLMLSLAQEKKNPLLVGPSGVGKTAIVDELAYRIQNGNVPNFLRDNFILEIIAGDIVKGCQYVGSFEERFIRLLNLCEKIDILLFIDEIHEIYGTGSSSKNDNDMASILKHYLERTNLKVIGTTTDIEYDKYFSCSPLKRRFDKISVLEPDGDSLFSILNKVMEDYCLKNHVSFRDERLQKKIAQILSEYTAVKYRNCLDIVNNPDLAISIIDKAFALAKFGDSEYMESAYFIESLENFDRLSRHARQRMCYEFKKLDSTVQALPKQKNLVIEFKKDS